jgi:hypothetical protein
MTTLLSIDSSCSNPPYIPSFISIIDRPSDAKDSLNALKNAFHGAKRIVVICGKKCLLTS